MDEIQSLNSTQKSTRIVIISLIAIAINIAIATFKPNFLPKNDTLYGISVWKISKILNNSIPATIAINASSGGSEPLSINSHTQYIKPTNTPASYALSDRGTEVLP